MRKITLCLKHPFHWSASLNNVVFLRNTHSYLKNALFAS